MRQRIELGTPRGGLVWGRLTGHWGAREWARLETMLARLPLEPGTRVVLDLSALRHLQLRAVPRLLALASALRERGAELVLTGLSDYLVKLVELSGGIEGRDLIERHAWMISPLPGPADPAVRRGLWPVPASGPHGLGVASVN